MNDEGLPLLDVIDVAITKFHTEMIYDEDESYNLRVVYQNAASKLFYGDIDCELLDWRTMLTEVEDHKMFTSMLTSSPPDTNRLAGCIAVPVISPLRSNSSTVATTDPPTSLSSLRLRSISAARSEQMLAEMMLMAASDKRTDAEKKKLWHTLQVVCLNRDDGLHVLVQKDVSSMVRYERALSEMLEMHMGILSNMLPRHAISELLRRIGSFYEVPVCSLESMRVNSCRRHDTSLSTTTSTSITYYPIEAYTHRDVTVLFMDVVSFTKMADMVSGHEVMEYLNVLYSGLDDLLDVHGVQKVETAGDCYIVAAGVLMYDDAGFGQVLQTHDAVLSAEKVLAFAQDMRNHVHKVLMPGTDKNTQVRIGIHTGPCVSGIVGKRLPKFGIFGDTMNTASRMESTAPHGEIHVSSSTHALLKEHHVFEATGSIEVKGKSAMNTYLWRGPRKVTRITDTWRRRSRDLARSPSFPSAESNTSTHCMRSMFWNLMGSSS